MIILHRNILSWHNNQSTTTEIASRRSESFLETQNATYDIEFLLDQIGDRDAVVDACLPPQLAEDLRRRNINAVWVPAILGDGVSDEEIERELLIGKGLLWESRKDQKVLLTRDVRFSRKLKGRGILVRYHPTMSGTTITNKNYVKN